jgi:hypothetical protein
MIIFLHGPDAYRRSAKEREIIAAYRDKHGMLGSARFDLGEKDAVKELSEFLGNASIFELDKLAIAENISADIAPELAKLLKPYLKDSGKTTILIINNSKPPAKLSFLATKPTRSQEFPLLSGRELKSFIDKESARRGLKLKTAVASGLAAAFDGDSWSIITELDKLALMKEQTLEAKPAPNYFELLNGFKYGRDLRSKLVALEFMLSDRDDEPARIFNGLSYRLRDRREAMLLADYDAAVKSGKLDYEEALLDLALRN